MSEQSKEYNEALLKLHGEIEVLKKDESNPFYNSSYVPLRKMLATLKPLYQKHGFVLTQPTRVDNLTGTVVNIVTSKLTHVKTGMFETAELAITPDLLPKADMQKLGGAITYGRRYTLSALNGLEEVDDDGNLASNKTSSATASKSVSAKSTGSSSFRKGTKKTETVSTSVATGDDI